MPRRGFFMARACGNDSSPFQMVVSIRSHLFDHGNTGHFDNELDLDGSEVIFVFSVRHGEIVPASGRQVLLFVAPAVGPQTRTSSLFAPKATVVSYSRLNFALARERRKDPFEG